MYNVLDFGNDDDSTADGSMVTTVQPTSATTVTASTIGNGTSMANSAEHPGLVAAINQSIAPAFNQVIQNQTILQQQIAAMSIAPPPPTAVATHSVQQVAFPMQQPFQPTAPQYPGYGRGTSQQFTGRGYQSYNAGRGFYSGRQGQGGGRSRNCQRRPAFATMMRTEPAGFPGIPGMFAPPNNFWGPGPFAPIMPVQMGNVPSPVKRYTNWNACFSCGFDVEDGHTSMT
jgi:hypothetical protein